MSAAVVVLCALEVLGRSAESFPTIQILDEKPLGVSSDADAFVDTNGRVIYLLA